MDIPQNCYPNVLDASGKREYADRNSLPRFHSHIDKGCSLKLAHILSNKGSGIQEDIKRLSYPPHAVASSRIAPPKIAGSDWTNVGRGL
jgi:hypothetical protein